MRYLRAAGVDASVVCARSEGFWTTPRRASLIGLRSFPLQEGRTSHACKCTVNNAPAVAGAETHACCCSFSKSSGFLPQPNFIWTRGVSLAFCLSRLQMYRKQRADGRGRGDARLLLGLGPRPFAAGLGRADGLVLVLLVVLPLQLLPATARRFWGTVRARP